MLTTIIAGSVERPHVISLLHALWIMHGLRKSECRVLLLQGSVFIKYVSNHYKCSKVREYIRFNLTFIILPSKIMNSIVLLVKLITPLITLKLGYNVRHAHCVTIAD